MGGGGEWGGGVELWLLSWCVKCGFNVHSRMADVLYCIRETCSWQLILERVK